MTCIRKKNAEEINASGIRAKMCDVISGEFKRLIESQVDPWIFFNSKGVHVKRFVGKDISMSGGKYNDSSSQVFFGYIEPYIADAIKRMIEKTIDLANKKKVSISAVIDSTKANLSGGIDTVYHKMQEVDRRLRGNGYPESVSLEIKKMTDFLDRQIRTYEDLAFRVPDSRFKKWYDKSPHVKWLIGIIISVLALIISAVAIICSIFAKNQ